MKLSLLPKNQFLRVALIVFSLLYFSIHAYSLTLITSLVSDTINSSKDTLKSQPTDFSQDSVFVIADKMPSFPGGKEEGSKFVANNLHYPADAMNKNQQGRVIVQFIVGKTGKIRNARVVKKVAPSLDKEALRMVDSFPTWIPGELNGRKVDVYQSMPITFKLGEDVNSELNWVPNEKTLVVIDSLNMPLKFNINLLSADEIDTGYVLKPIPIESRQRLIHKYGPLAENGVIFIRSKSHPYSNIITSISPKDTSTIQIVDTNKVYTEVDKMPQFPGGERVLYKFISSKLEFPAYEMENGIKGRIIVRFIVDKTGNVRDAEVIKKLDRSIDPEVIRVISNLPDMFPGEKAGVKVNTYYTLPITFKWEITRSRIGKSISRKIVEEYSNSNRVKEKHIIMLDGNKLPIGFDLNWLNFKKIESLEVSYPKKVAGSDLIIEKYGKISLGGIIDIKSNKNNSPINSIQNGHKDSSGNKVYTVIEIMPQFPGGENVLKNFIKHNNNYTESAKKKGIQGRVIVRFIVTSEGKVEQSEVIKSFEPGCDKEALRIINSMPIWIPGKQNGKNVSVWYTLPITFE